MIRANESIDVVNPGADTQCHYQTKVLLARCLSASVTRDLQLAKVISNAPDTIQGTLTRAFNGSASPRQAIKAMCLCCVGFDRNSIKTCTGYSCPLWCYRPFQDFGEPSAGRQGEA